MRKSNMVPKKAQHQLLPVYIISAVVVCGFIIMAMFQGAVIEDPFHVSIHLDEEHVTTVQTKSDTVQSILRMAGVLYEEHDVITPSLNTVLTEDTSITIRQARPVTVTADGSSDVHWVTEHAVQDILRELGVKLSSFDRVVPSLASHVAADEEIRVIRIAEEIVEEKETLPFK